MHLQAENQTAECWSRALKLLCMCVYNDNHGDCTTDHSFM